ncbi:class I adenylate-forming enzyme family protein [Haloarcula montana]|uniref:class I adenylate-forming enzyme family protein n=1 Tax=Haloarcula montana TaxID=3111776 RepID=UPI002D775C68|nr:AMP-binding protein [Haloarcula sp. GH36]
MREPVDWPTRDLVSHRVASTPERPAVVDADGDRTWSYRDLDDRVDTVAARFAAETDSAGGEDELVAALVDTRPEIAPLLFGAMRAGVTLVPLNVDLVPATLGAQLARVDPALLVCERETERMARDIADCPVVSVDEPSVDGVVPLAIDREPPDPVALSRTDEQVVLFTSGTTSDPKGVRLTVGNLVASATASAFRLGVRPDDRWLVALPTYHMGGLAPFLRGALYGTTVVVQRSFDPSETAVVMNETDVTGVSLVPTMLSRLLDEGWTPPDSLQTVLLGGGPADQALVDRCREASVPVHPTYGMTETASQIATARPQTAFDYPGTVGQPLVFTEVTVVDDGSPCEPGERGELVVDGPTVTPGYLDGERTAAAFGSHGFHTGDLGYRDEDGRLWVVGRADDRIVTGGENVVAGDVAATIRESEGVTDAVVVGVPDEEWGQRVAALVTGTVAPGAVRDYCEGRLAPYEVPKTIRVVKALPRTASGTVDREAARTLVEGSE